MVSPGLDHYGFHSCSTFQLYCQAVLPRYLLKPIPGERDLGVELKVEMLKSIRGPSRDGTFFLRKECIRRAYQLVKAPSAAPLPLDDTTLFVDHTPGRPSEGPKLESLSDPARYCEVVQTIRRTLKPGYVLLFHYTNARVIEVLLRDLTILWSAEQTGSRFCLFFFRAYCKAVFECRHRARAMAVFISLPEVTLSIFHLFSPHQVRAH